MQRTPLVFGYFVLCIPFLLRGATVEDLLRQAEIKIQAEQFEAAEPLLLKALKLEPNHTSALYRLGYAHYRQRKLDPARQEFGSVVKLAPPAYYSRYFLGRIALLEDKPLKAITWLEPILEARQSVFDTAAQLSSAYSGSGKPQKAIQALGIALSEAPWDASLFYRLGRLYGLVGKKELAAEAMENNTRLRNASREDVEVLMRVAKLLGEGNQAEALRSGKQIRERANSDPNALVALGIIYGNRNLQAQALDVFEIAAKRDPKFFQAHFNHGLALLKLDRSSEAAEPLARAVGLLPQSIEASKTFGVAAVMNRRYAEAIPHLERAWQSDSSDARVGALLATSYLRTGSAKRAVAVLESDAFRSPAEPAPLLLRVEAMNAAEDPNAALGAAQELQRRFPQFPQSHLAVAQQFARLGRYQDAQPGFLAVLKLAPGHPEAELGLADTLSRAGDHAAAIEHYRSAAGSSRTSVAARAGMARSLIGVRQYEQARQALEEAIQAHPSEAVLHIELSRVYARLGKTELAAEQTRIVEKLRGERERPEC